MITCKLQNGLGNQMFQIATTYALALRSNDQAVFDLDREYELTQGKVPKTYKSSIFQDVPCGTLSLGISYKEPENYEPIQYKKNLILEGQFQDERYFEDYKDEIKKLFKLSNEVAREDDDPVTTAVCVRRGDYLTLNGYEVLPESYYKEAMDMIKEGAFIFVSDDIEWCRNTFTGSNVFYCPLTNDVDQMSFISVCTNVILANSTFGWWGAWLGEHDKGKIIAPGRWYTDGIDRKDIVPERWVKIDYE